MYEDKTIKQCIESTKTNLEKGLSDSEAKIRLERNGKNILKEKKKKGLLSAFLSQLNDPMIYILLVAIIISLFLKEVSDAIIIAIVVLLNAVIGTIQESKAEKALEALKQLSSPTSLVKRDGKIKEIKSEELVVGDILIIEAGRTVGADVRLVETINLKVEEASLTGESTSVEKDATLTFTRNTPLGDKINMAYMSTNAVYGRGEGIVVGTGMNTEVGKIADMINLENEGLTPLQKRLADLGKLLGILTIVLCALLFIVALIQKRDPIEMFRVAISLAVAAIPEGLPAVVTIVLALGVQRMVRVNTIVRRLPSVETLGAVSVVCSDKTGTLTQNKMNVTKIYYSGNLLSTLEANIKNCDIMVEGLVLCNDAIVEKDNVVGDPTEVALIELGRNFKLFKDDLNKKYPRIGEIPFDSERKMMSTIHQYKGHKRVFTKGALDSVLRRCKYMVVNDKVEPLSIKRKEDIIKKAEEMGKEALRVLSIAYKDSDKLTEEDLIFAGLAGMIDPPRSEAKDAVATFKEAGVTTVMITGDHQDTALAIARELGIANSETQCMNGIELEKISQEELNERVNNITVFARVSPEHKVKIVKAFKANGRIVAMTGDGVNDAPSLKTADIGIAMGISGTDVAKGASDMVLSDDNFASIEKAIEEGRGIYANIKKSVLFLLSSNFAEVIAMLVAILLKFPLPLIAVHILWINLITDSLPALALGSDPKEDDIMKSKPRDPEESLFSHGGLRLTIFYGVLIAVLTLVAFLSIPIAEIARQSGIDEVNYRSILMTLEDADILMKAQTFAFTTLAVSELFHAIGMRNIRKSVLEFKFLDNKLMLIAFAVGVLLQVMVTEIPIMNTFFSTTRLGIFDWSFILGLSLMVLLAHEVIALSFYIRGKRRKKSKVN